MENPDSNSKGGNNESTPTKSNSHGISKIFKPFKRESSKSMMLSSSQVNQAMQSYSSAGEENQQADNKLSQSVDTGSSHHPSAPQNPQINSVRFDESLNRSDSSSSIGSTSSTSVGYNRPRAKSEKKEKSTFNNIIRSLRKSKIPQDLESYKDKELPPIKEKEKEKEKDGSELKISSNSIASMASMTSQEEINQNILNQLQQQQEKKQRRSSIFVRLLNRKGNTISSEDDFHIENGSSHGNADAHVFSSTPNLNSFSPTKTKNLNYPNSMPSLSNTTSTAPGANSVDHLENVKLREELNEIKSEFSKKQDEWLQEKEEFIKKIQLLSETITSNTPNDNVPLVSHQHSQSSGTLQTMVNASGNPLQQELSINITSSLSNLPVFDSSTAGARSNREETLSHSSSSPQLLTKRDHHQSTSDTENDDFGIYNDDMNLELSMQQESSIETPFVNPLRMSTSSVTSRSTTPPRHRFSVSVPKLDSSMTFNGSNPFERLITILRNSTEIPNHLNSTPTKDLSSSTTTVNISPPLSPSSTTNTIISMPHLGVSGITSPGHHATVTPPLPVSPISSPVPTPQILQGLDEEKQKKVILSICLKKLITKLISENNDDSAVSKTFFATYECIYSAQDIIHELMDQFKIESPQSQMRILIILRNWFKDYYISQLCDSKFVNLIKDFLIEIKDLDNSYLYSKIIEVRNSLLYLLEGKINERSFLNSSTTLYDEVEKHFLNKKAIMKIKTFLSTSLKHISSVDHPFDDFIPAHAPSSPGQNTSLNLSPRSTMIAEPSTLSTNSVEFSSNNNPTFDYRPRSSTWSTTENFISIMDAPAKEIAKSLTVVDYSIFLCIETQEIMNGAWSKVSMKERAPNINKLIARFNDISMNVIQTILNETKLKDRCKVMARFIKIAKNLHDLRNYNSLMAIYAGISHSSITRLKWTKKILPKAHQKTLQDLEKLMDSDENFKNYRNEIKSLATTPCIPFSGLILSDMTFIQEGNPDFLGVDEGTWTVNMTKLKLVYSTIKQIQQFQKKPYLLNADPRLTLLLTPNLNIFGEFVPRLTDDQQFGFGINRNSSAVSTSGGIESDESEEETEKPTDKVLVSKDDSHIVNNNNGIDRLYDSFTLEDGTSRKSYSYNTWTSPKKSTERQPIDAVFKKKSVSLANMDKPNSPSKSLINPNSNSDKLVDSNLSLNLIQIPKPSLSINLNNIDKIDEEVSDQNTSNNSDNLYKPSSSHSEPNSMLPSPILPRASHSTSHSPSNTTTLLSAINNATNSFNSNPSTPNNSPVVGTIESNNSSGVISTEQFVFKSQPINKNRRKSVSTSNILSLGVVAPSNQAGASASATVTTNNSTHASTSSSPSNYKSHSRRSSVATSQSTSGSISPTQNYSIVNSHSHSSFSLFKRKSLNIESQIKQQTSSFFPPMSEESLFSLSLKLEPRGVKFSDLS